MPIITRLRGEIGALGKTMQWGDVEITMNTVYEDNHASDDKYVAESLTDPRTHVACVPDDAPRARI